MERSVWTRKTEHFMEETSYAWEQRLRRILLPEEEGELSWGWARGSPVSVPQGLAGKNQSLCPRSNKRAWQPLTGLKRTPSSGPREIINAEASEINGTTPGLQGAQSLSRGRETGPQWSVAG